MASTFIFCRSTTATANGKDVQNYYPIPWPGKSLPPSPSTDTNPKNLVSSDSNIPEKATFPSPNTRTLLFHQKRLLVNFDCTAMWVKRSAYLVDALALTPDIVISKEYQRGQVSDYRDWQVNQGVCILRQEGGVNICFHFINVTVLLIN